MDKKETLEQYEVRVIGGVQFLYYKGEKLPCQTKSVVVQDMEMVEMITGKASLCEVTITVKALLRDTKE